MTSLFKRWARFAAAGWTLLIFIGCLWPGKELPDVQVPFVDKWVHLVLFGGFTFLWLVASAASGWNAALLAVLAGCLLGWFIELLQLWLPALGRSYDLMDILADGTGALLGTGLYYLIRRWKPFQRLPGI